jgi:hypothetical protein
MKPNQQESQTIAATCVNCKRPTRHLILKAYSETGETEYVDWYEITYQIIQCLGCTNVCFRRLSLSSEDTDHDGRPLDLIDIYPDPTKRIPQMDIYKLPKHVRNLYTETLTCFDSTAMTMSAAGLRAVVEATCLDQGCISGNLKDKIDCRTTKGVLLKRDADHCTAQIKEARNASVEVMTLAESVSRPTD